MAASCTGLPCGCAWEPSSQDEGPPTPPHLRGSELVPTWRVTVRYCVYSDARPPHTWAVSILCCQRPGPLLRAPQPGSAASLPREPCRASGSSGHRALALCVCSPRSDERLEGVNRATGAKAAARLRERTVRPSGVAPRVLLALDSAW